MAVVTVSVQEVGQLTQLDKPATEFRDYSAKTEAFDRVSDFYHKNHKYQTAEFVKQMHAKYVPLSKKQMTLWQAFDMMEEIVDESDPDTDSAQIVHAYQTAEALRKKYPQQDYLHLAGFIHDLGKIIAHPKFGSEPQWCVVGDTFPIGCAYSDKCVYPQFFKENSDYHNPRYNTLYGIYQPNCGLEQITMSWGHDEYMYQVCKANGCTLPDEALYVIRFHSFYAWHSGNSYTHLTNEKDQRLLEYVRAFQKCDLYSKSDETEDKPDPVKLRPYYQSLIDKYFPNAVLQW